MTSAFARSFLFSEQFFIDKSGHTARYNKQNYLACTRNKEIHKTREAHLSYLFSDRNKALCITPIASAVQVSRRYPVAYKHFGNVCRYCTANQHTHHKVIIFTAFKLLAVSADRLCKRLFIYERLVIERRSAFCNFLISSFSVGGLLTAISSPVSLLNSQIKLPSIEISGFRDR